MEETSKPRSEAEKMNRQNSMHEKPLSSQQHSLEPRKHVQKDPTFPSKPTRKDLFSAIRLFLEAGMVFAPAKRRPAQRGRRDEEELAKKEIQTSS